MIMITMTMTIMIFFKNNFKNNFIHTFKKIDYLQIQEYEY